MPHSLLYAEYLGGGEGKAGWKGEGRSRGRGGEGIEEKGGGSRAEEERGRQGMERTREEKVEERGRQGREGKAGCGKGKGEKEEIERRGLGKVCSALHELPLIWLPWD